MSETELELDPADIEDRIADKVLGGIVEKPPSEEPPPAEQPPAVEQPPAEAEIEIPEHLQGKSAEELLRMQIETERERGRLGTELGEARRQLEEYESRAPEQEQPQYEPPPPPQLTAQDVTDFDAFIETAIANDQPDVPIKLAVQLGDDFLYERALNAWADVDEFAALRYDNQRQLQLRDERLIEQLRPVLLPAMHQQHNAELVAAWNQAKAQGAPDIDSYAQEIRTILTENRPLARVFQEARPEERAQIYRVLYDTARARKGTQGTPPGTPLMETAPPEPPLPYVATGENGRQPTPQGKPVDVVAHAIRQWAASEPTIDVGLST